MKDKLTNNLIYILAFLIIFSIIPLVKAELSAEEVFDNVGIRLYGPGGVRVWNATFVSVTISNFNNDIPVIIDDLSILNSKNELIFFNEVNFTSYPVGNEKKTVDKVKKMCEKIISKYDPIVVLIMLYAPMVKNANSEIKEHEFHKQYHFYSDIDKFNPVLNKDIIVNLRVTLRYGDKISIKETNYSIRMEQPLPRFH